MKTLTRNEIKNILGLTNWSIRCERIEKILKTNKIKEFCVQRSSDYKFAKRHTRMWTNIENIGCNFFGSQYRNYIYFCWD